MTYALGLRLMAALMFLLSMTIILWPVCFPLGVFFWWKARSVEKERKRR